MFNEFGYRFSKHINIDNNNEIIWNDEQLQQACLNFAMALDDIYNNNISSINTLNPYQFTNILWKEIYQSSRNIDFESLFLFSKYIYNEILNLDDINHFHFLNGWWSFNKIPNNNDKIYISKLINESNTIQNILKNYNY